MRWGKEHLIGLILGVIGYELYYRQQKGKGSTG